jgi:hypothetical protein
VSYNLAKQQQVLAIREQGKNMKRNIVTLGAGLLTLFGATSTVQAYTAEWSVTGTYTEIVAADCRDCEEDIGILFACTGNGQAAEITVNAAASERGQDGAFAPVTFHIDGQRYTYDAKTVEFGLIGFTPVFQISYDDPLTEALQAGRKATVRFNGERSNIGLKGSRSALNVFKAHCGWTPQGYQQNLERTGAQNTDQNQQQEQQSGQQQSGLPPYSQTVLAKNPPTPGADGLFWYTGDGFGGGSPKALRYALPETDEAMLSASCERYDVNGVLLETYIWFGGMPADAPVTLEITHAQGTSRFQGTTFIENEEYAGARFTVPKGDPVWRAIAASGQVSIGIQGENAAQLSGASGSAALNEFSILCSN